MNRVEMSPPVRQEDTTQTPVTGRASPEAVSDQSDDEF